MTEPAKWLAETLGKDPATISCGCNNHVQPSLETLDKITKLLDANRHELIHRSK